MEKLKDIDTLLFSGGAMKCVSILGSLRYLFEENIIHSSFKGIRDIYFVSGSSIYITPLIIGLSLDSTIDLFKKIDYKGIYENSPEMKLQNLFDNYGLKKITDFKFIMIAIFKNKGIDKNITLNEFYELTNINIHFRVININKGKTEYLNKDNSPDLEYIDAVAMTCCIPLLFEPFEYNGFKYIDGGVNNNFPYEIIINKKNYIGINIVPKISLDSKEEEIIELKDLSQYLSLLYNLYGSPPIEKPCINHIKLAFDGSGINFNKLSSIINETILLGYNTTKEHFTNFQKHNDSSPPENEG
tara:strand:+ start:1631 stop:2530 length:900 start_codon:yes stop_codon:yes gene_type:complete